MNVFYACVAVRFFLWFLCLWGGKLVSFLYACLVRSVCLWNLNPNALVLFRSCFIFYLVFNGICAGVLYCRPSPREPRKSSQHKPRITFEDGSQLIYIFSQA